MILRKKLIEVALPLEDINKEALLRKQKAPKGWPTSFHKWWAQRPLASARAVIFSQMVDDPSSVPELFPTTELQQNERDRLFQIIKELIDWQNTTNSEVQQKAFKEIQTSWKRACKDNNLSENHDVFDPENIPYFYDPFGGGGCIPLSSQWLGLKTLSSDLNPVAVLINKALIELPSKFSGFKPINPEINKDQMLFEKNWDYADGIAEDVRYYGNLFHKKSIDKIGNLFPKILITQEIVDERPDLKDYLNSELTVIAYMWARTVKSPNPGFPDLEIPLISNYVISSRPGKEAYIEPVIKNNTYSIKVRVGKFPNENNLKQGNKLSRGANFKCLVTNEPVSGDYIKLEGKARRLGSKLIAIVAEGARGRVYLSPNQEQEQIALNAKVEWKPEVTISGTTQYLGMKPYGIDRVDQLFTNRQLITLSTLSELISVIANEVKIDYKNNIKVPHDQKDIDLYACAIAIYLACVVDRVAYYGSTLVSWLPKDSSLGPSMPRQAMAMTWDYVEANPFGKSSGDILSSTNSIINFLKFTRPNATGNCFQQDAQSQDIEYKNLIYSTDPPYYDNIPYADLSDFFYPWLRKSLKSFLPELFSTVSTPKEEELVALSYRHNDGKVGAEHFFLDGMTQAMKRIADISHPAFPITIYYAFKQTETDSVSGTTNTGWDTFLEAIIKAGLMLTGTWPMRTESAGRMLASGTNALASSIVLVCRKRTIETQITTRREFISILKKELPESLRILQLENIAPVDLAQASIGPGMAIYTRFMKILDAEGSELSVRDALSIINKTLDEALAEQEGDFDADSRWALTWFEQSGFSEGDYGVAEQLSKSKNTSVLGLVEAGILFSRAGKVRLLKPIELPEDWDPTNDKRLTVWEMVHHLIRALESHGEKAASVILKKLGSKAEAARELCYRLYTICERKKRSNEAMAYNGLVQSWPEILALSREQDLVVLTSTENINFERN